MNFPWLQAIVIVTANLAFSGGLWLIWPSRWNVIAVSQLGFFFVAYFFPILFTDVLRLSMPAVNPFHEPALLSLYMWIMAVGAFAYLVGLIFGVRSPRIRLSRGGFFRLSLLRDAADYVRRRTVLVATLATVGIYVSFAIMGYVPALAGNPQQAKYFHDEYRPGYLRAIWLYLPSYSAFLAYLPILMVITWRRWRFRYIVIFLAGIAAVALVLHRGEFGLPLLLGVGLIIASTRTKHAAAWFCLISIIIWSVGAAMNFLIAFYLDIKMVNLSRSMLVDPPTATSLIAEGAPDVGENLQFLDGFLEHGQYTFGRNWIGGLVPFQSYWNPGIWALSVALNISHEEALNSAGGGLRLAVPILGYSCLDWLGTVGFSFAIGFFSGYVIAFAKRQATAALPIEVKAVSVVVAGILIDNVNAPTWHTLLPLLALVPLMRPHEFDWWASVSKEMSAHAELAAPNATP